MRLTRRVKAWCTAAALLLAMSLIGCAASAPPGAGGVSGTGGAAGGAGVAGFGGAGGVGGFGGVGGVGGFGGVGGVAGAAGGVSGSSGWIDGGDGVLQLHVEDPASLAIDLVTVQCAGDCAEVVAVARGGRGAISYRWDDGSTEPRRTVCPSDGATYVVTASDTPQPDGEFPYPGQTAQSSVSTRVVGCVDAGVDAGGSDAGSGTPCATDSECGRGSVCYQGICVGEGGLRFSLSWMVDTDYDLHVLTPNGTEIFYGNSVAEGGQLDVDDCAGSCRVFGGPHVENIYFGLNPPRGTYTYWVVNFSGTFTDNYELQVAHGGVTRATQNGTLSALVLQSPYHTFVY